MNNARTRIGAIVALVLGAWVARGMVGCSSAGAPENIGSTRQAVINPSGVNWPVACTSNHETAVAYISGGGSDLSRGRWVMATINFDGAGSTNYFSSAYSTDGNGNSWAFANQANGTDFGCPGGACPGTPSPSDGSSFTGWLGDPSIAAITDPSLSNGGRRVVVAMLPTTVNHPSTGTYAADVIVALSEDGGQTWGNIQWVDTNATNGSATDLPFVFSNPLPPYDTYVSWRAGNTGYLRKIQWSGPPNATFSAGPVIPIPKASNDTGFVDAFRFGFGTLPQNCTSGQEGIFVVYTNGAERCSRGPTREDRATTYWNFAVYDTGQGGKWRGVWPILTDAHFSRCAGSPTTSAYSNTTVPSIAVDPTNSRVWVTHTRQASATAPTRTSVESALIACPVGPPSFETVFSSPDPCPGCGAADNWLPAIAMHRSGTNPRVAVYWYGTNDFYNTQATLYASFQENLGVFSAPVQLTTANYPVLSNTSWTVGGVDMFDYQMLGTSWQNASFLSVWAVDRRSVRVIGWNGGFETGSLRAGGPSGTDWVGGGAAYAVSGADKHSGTYSAVLGSSAPTNGDSTLTQTFNAPLNTRQISLWYKSVCAGPGCPDSLAYDWAQATLRDNVTMGTSDVLPRTYNVGGAWTETQNLGIVPGRSYTLTLINHDNNSGGDALYTCFDDVSFGENVPTAMMSTLSR